MEQFILTNLHDIEDLHEYGKATQTCSYYASRKAIPLAEIVAVPYNALLHRPTRQSLKIDIENAVIIIDEAHNLTDAISEVHSITINGKERRS